MNKAININAKDRFARLLATENIDVIHDSKAETASFNTASRVLRLPRWKEMSGQLYDMLVAHEVGHALYTPNRIDDVTEIADRHGVDPMVAKDYVNVVEDARIERLMKQKFPGLRRDFISAYNDLMNREFFGDLSGINDMAFIDRINLHYKAGTIGMNVRFDEDENRIINTIDESETWEDVLDIVDTLLVDAAKKVKEQEQEQGNQGLKGDPGDEDDDSETPESEPTDDDATDSSESDSSESTEQSSETPDIKSDTVQRSETQQKFEDSMEEFREKQTRWGDDGVDQIESVPVFNPEDCMTDWTALYNADSTTYGGDGGMDKYYTNEKLTSDGLDEVSRFMDESRKICRGMAQEFLRKQKAVAFRRATIAKTGVLDMQKMVNYKWSEDIFRKSTILPNGKNHGLVILVDWSQSMECVMKDTIRQAIQMAMFCRMINIPFEVYSFSSVGDEYNENWRTNKTTEYKNDKGEKIYDSNLRMRNYLSSRMPKKRFYDACHRMGIMSTCWDWHTRMSPRYADRLGSTPLDDAIWTMTQWLPKYRESNGIEIMNTLFISDGATTTHLTRGTRTVIRDGHHYFGRQSEGDWRDSTKVALDVLRHRSGTRLVQFFLVNNKGIADKFGRSRIHGLHGTDSEMIACQEQYKKEKWCIAPNKDSFDERFIMHGKNSVQNTDGFSDMGRSDEDGVTITKIRNSFVKSMKQTTTSRAMLNRFIDIIA
jgi:hypothetical protein